jgi:hypothetical protein
MGAGAAAAAAPAVLRQMKALQQADPDCRTPITWVPLPVQPMAKLTKSGIVSVERQFAEGIENRTETVPAGGTGPRLGRSCI